jgi:hypothetical protein
MDRARGQTQGMFGCRPTDVRVYGVLLRRPELPEDPRRVDDFPEDDFRDDRPPERDPREERSCSPLLERYEARDSLFERDSEDPPLLLSSCSCLFSNPFFNCRGVRELSSARWTPLSCSSLVRRCLAIASPSAFWLRAEQDG